MPTRQSSDSLNASRILSTAGTPPKQQWHGVYMASCCQNNDPLGEGRIKMYIPQVLGTAVSNWARPLGYKPTDVPAVGTMLHAYFAGGDVNHPIWVRTDLTNEFTAVQNQINNIGPGPWQNITLSNGWSNIGGFIPAQVRILSTGVAQIVGNVSGGSFSDSTVLGNIPNTIPLPSGSQVIPCTILGGGTIPLEGNSLGAFTDTAGLTDGTINGLSGTEGLSNGTINGNSASASGAGSHTHGGGSYAVTNGQHDHDSGSFSVADGNHEHGTSLVNVETSFDTTSPIIQIDPAGDMILFGVQFANQISFSGTLVTS